MENAPVNPSASWKRQRGAVVEKAREMMRTVKERGEGLKQSPKGAINICTLFNGMGSWLQAVEEVGLPVGKIYISEWDARAAAVAKAHWPQADVGTLQQDVSGITEEQVVAMGDLHLFLASPPCTDFSKLKKTAARDGRAGLEGTTGCLFRDVLKIWKWVKQHNPECQFVVENVVFEDMSDDWREVCEVLGTPTQLNSRDYAYAWRKRAFWSSMTNVRGVLEAVVAPQNINDVLDPGRSHEGRVPTLTASWVGDDVTPKEHTKDPIKVWDSAAGAYSFLRPNEAELLMGLPLGFTEVPALTNKDRLCLLGNGVDLAVVRRVLSQLRWTHACREEAQVRQAADGTWGEPILHAVAEPLQLNAEAMAEWLTPGECPVTAMTAEWTAAWHHPSVEQDVEEWAHGARLRYEGDREDEVLAPNCASSWQAAAESRAAIWSEVEKGRILGPFPHPPLQGFKSTPRAIIDEMEKSNKWRPISSNNLPVGRAVNEGIPQTDVPICLPTHRRIQQKIRQAYTRAGRVVLAKRDIKSAYRNVQVHPDDWHLCGLQWDGQYFVDTHLSFGCRSSVDRFLTVTDALEWALRRWGVNVVHYIDDFVFVSDSYEEAEEAIAKFEIICRAWGLPIKEEKNVGPGERVTLLGVDYDMVAMTAAMPAATLKNIKTACSEGAEGMLVTNAETLVGVLTWASSCVVAASTFVQSLR